MIHTKAAKSAAIVTVIVSFLLWPQEASPYYYFGNPLYRMDKGDKLFAANVGGLLFITGWGIVNWDYGQKTPRSNSEGWFSQSTRKGGADKLGHFYSTYALSHYAAWLCESWGYSENKAAFYGSLSSFGLMGFMELGDSFSGFGFSHEDFIMNTAGAITGYMIKRYPELSKKLDFRIEYNFKFEQADAFTDYNSMKFLAAIKLDGFRPLRPGWWQYLEIHLGYYTRGFNDNTSESERFLYAGLGINLSKIVSNLSFKRTASFLRYVQPPNTDLQVKRKLQNNWF